MQVELTCATAFDPILGLVARGPIDHHRTSRQGAGGVGAPHDLGFEALTPAVHRRAAEAFAAVARWAVVSNVERARAWCGGLEYAPAQPMPLEGL